MESKRTIFILPAELVDIRLFVEVVTILTYVVKLGVYGSVVFPSAATTSLSAVTRKERLHLIL